MNDEFLSRGQAAVFLGVSTRTIERLDCAGAIPRIQVSARRVLYSKAALMKYLASRTTRGTHSGE